MSLHGDLAGGAFQRRRDRRLRLWLRHERMSVRMALAEALHSTKKVVERREGSEEVGHEKYVGPRAQNTCTSGDAPGASV